MEDFKLAGVVSAIGFGIGYLLLGRKVYEADFLPYSAMIPGFIPSGPSFSGWENLPLTYTMGPNAKDETKGRRKRKFSYAEGLFCLMDNRGEEVTGFCNRPSQGFKGAKKDEKMGSYGFAGWGRPNCRKCWLAWVEATPEERKEYLEGIRIYRPKLNP